MSLTPPLDPHENLFIIEDKCLLTNRITKYIKGNFLGKGGFARCYEVRKQDTQQIYAVKVIQKCNLTKPRSKQKLVSQIQIHQSLRHQNIVEFKHTFEDNLNIYILLELCPNRSMNDLLKQKKKLTESELQFYMMQLLEALLYLHNKKIIHRDLKLGNLFLAQKMVVKLGDFGLASKIQFIGEKRKTICGTPNYIAPEILDAKGHSYEVDIWSFGVIMYTLTFGRPPFEAKDVKETYKKIKLNLYSFPDCIPASAALKALINNILQKDPSKRPTLKQIKQHEFFRGTNLSRQPSANKSLKNQQSSNINTYRTNLSSNKKDIENRPEDRSDNGKLYTNNQIIHQIERSKDEFKKQKTLQKFINTQRKPSCFKTPVKEQRVKSQKVLKQTKQIKEIEQNLFLSNEDISVKKWIDYSSKYGIGYLLNNKTYGVYFNDSTKMIAQDDNYFYYIEKISKEDIPKKFSFSDYPNQIKKKVGLYSHFKSYLKIDQKSVPPAQEKSYLDLNNLVYIKRWFRSKHAVIFRMNNKTVQVIFVDQTEIIINSFSKMLIYYSKGHQKVIFAIHEVMQSGNKELIKRFQYTKEVLNEMAKVHEQKKEGILTPSTSVLKRKASEKKQNIKEKSLFFLENKEQNNNKILQEKEDFGNTLQTPRKGFNNQIKNIKFQETVSVKKFQNKFQND